MPDRKTFAKSFHTENNNLEPETPESMAIWPECHYSLFAQCSSRSCVLKLNEKQKEVFDKLVNLLVYAIMTYAPFPLEAAKEPMVLALAAWQSSLAVDRLV